ncbi:hypothetical protein BAG01nite_05500 [Brevibacillus agri]|uniref:Uncharacterized protein n=1 Tax=Brevibacillus agri TaxID=51101 RepID=A0A3M8BC79_9BACL|nr:hypothetical protein [Brevibacillus agri]MED3498507.1 hypothetical protein [Brevibacillus agri]QAV14008.1 hypothetical protein BA6348_15295 [Brevibacillus agri]RNB60882.1 hypothetical protein EB820_01775 [Brevibacillus agri]GED24448.1 hypothetical protein BAG01nite_05500 [Brevibacillus agri]
MCARNLNALYRNESFQQTVVLPEQVGTGYWQRTSLNAMVDVMICDIVFREELGMKSTERDDWMKICFGARTTPIWTMASHPVR